jgi:hypothetical protein
MIAVLEMVAQIKQPDLFGVFRAHEQPVQIPGASLSLSVTDLCQLKSFREYLRRMKTAGRAVSSMAAASSQL